MLPFLNGLSVCGSFVTGLLFLRFWRETGDRLFVWFALTFWMLAVNWTAVSFRRAMDATRYLYFVARLIGCVLILVAIVDKNRDHSAHR